jgi:hypothetical protein
LRPAWRFALIWRADLVVIGCLRIEGEFDFPFVERIRQWISVALLGSVNVAVGLPAEFDTQACIRPEYCDGAVTLHVSLIFPSDNDDHNGADFGLSLLKKIVGRIDIGQWHVFLRNTRETTLLC